MTIFFIILPLSTLFFCFFRTNANKWFCNTILLLVFLSTWNLVQIFFHGGVKKLDLGEFLRVGPDSELSIHLGIYLDFYSSYMIWVVFTISFLVHVYSISYMGTDPRRRLFITYLTLFTFFMIFLLVSPNYVQLFMGWEGVGLTSYLLVNFWTTRTAANKSALKALVVNRVGDLFFLWGLFILIREGQTLTWASWASLPSGVGPLWVGAAAAKSAQLGLHTWLPDAIEGPTPVSALIHAATMVTAGLFLLFRAPHFVEAIRPLVGILGALTALFAGTVALFQFDLKRVIAYSTCSQLGYMVVAYSVGAPELSLYHLGNHAFFKALLFLLAGLVIHALGDEQDMRRMGGLVQVLPVTYSLFLVGSFALTGVPFLSGFYSKDLILEILYAQESWFTYFSCVAAAWCTAFYSVRTIVLVFAGQPRGFKHSYLHAVEGDEFSLRVVAGLGFLSLLHGWFTRDLFIGWGVTTHWATPVVAAEFTVPGWVKLAPLVVSLTGGLCAVMGFHPGSLLGQQWSNFLTKRWNWDLIDSSLSRRTLIKGFDLYTDIERGFFEMVGPTGVNWVVGRGYDLFRQRGWLPNLWFAGLFGFTVIAVAAGSSFEALPIALLLGIQDHPPVSEVTLESELALMEQKKNKKFFRKK